MQFAAIKRCIDNDFHDFDNHMFTIKIFDKRDDAVTWLLSEYEYWESGSGWNSSNENQEIDEKFGPDAKQYIVMYNFLMNSANDQGIFHWTWKRRSCNRTYRIVELTGDGEIKFNDGLRHLFKLKNGRVVEKKR